MFRIPDTAQLLKHSSRTGVALAACLSAAALVAGCGGGDRVKPFQPQQIIAFGDENSAFDDSWKGSAPVPLVRVNGQAFKGMRYTVNLLTIVESYCSMNPGPQTSSSDCTDTTELVLPTGATFTPSSSIVPVFSANSFVTSPTVRAQLINELETGSFSTAPTTTVFRTTDRYYECSPSVPNAGGYVGNWVQTMATSLGAGLSLGGANNCPQDSGNGQSYAAWGAKVDDVRTQFNNHRGELRDGVLVTMLAGQNDIIAAYRAVLAGADENAQKKILREKGAQLAGVINDIVSTGARVVYLLVPDMGNSPRAVIDGRTALASALTKAFNVGYQAPEDDKEIGGLELNVKFNGHKIVKVDALSQINGLAGSYPSGAAGIACDESKIKMPDGSSIATEVPATVNDPDLKAKALLLNCTSETLQGTSDFSAFLWADDLRLSPMGHAALAALAIARVRDQL